jgi:hypothetical protein
MSGSSDYTQTPNLGLYKPVANMAVGTWGDLWNSNADALDSAIHASTGGGPYLPLAGNATVFGPVTFSDAVTFAGGQYLPVVGTAMVNPLTLTFTNLDVPGNNSGQIIRWTNTSVPGALPPNNVVTAPLNIIASDYAGAVSSIFGINVSMSVSSTMFGTPGVGPWPQDCGANFTIAKVNNGNPWVAGVHITARSQNIRPSSIDGALTGMEIAHQASGDDDGGLASAPGLRLGIHMSQFAWSETPVWTANTAYTIGAVINPTSGSGAVYTYICTVAGTSGATQPSWPTSAGTVTDGTVTWSFNGFSCVFAMGYAHDGGPDGLTKSVFGVLGSNTYQVFDARSAVAPAGYPDPVAGLRMSAGQIVDFNGASTATHAGWIGPAGSYLQYVTAAVNRLRWVSGGNEVMSINDLGTLIIAPLTPNPAIVIGLEDYISFTSSENRNLGYTQVGTPRLRYMSGATELYAITDAGRIIYGVLPTNAVSDSAAATAGVPIGGVYRNGSALQVRVA